MRGTVVSVLRGGPSREHDVSLATGHAVIANLPRATYTARDIYIDRAGVWHERGLPTTPARVLETSDVVFNALHGEYGEDGTVQRLLEQFGVPYTGSNAFGSHLAFHKVFAKEHALAEGIRTARYYYLEPDSDIEAVAHTINRAFMPPVVVKDVAAGSSYGVSFVHGFLPLVTAIRALFSGGSIGVLVEERISGTEATVGVVEGLRGEELYALPPVEIIPPTSEGFFSTAAKYSGETKEICPGRFTRSVSGELQKYARAMHNALGLRHYSRSDFIVSARGIYYLETNTLPGMTSESLLPKSLQAVGVGFSDFLEHLIACAKGERRG